MNYFGTDGIRGTYGSSITDDTAFLLGKSLATLTQDAVVVVGHDTRVSAGNLLCALTRGMESVGGKVVNIGVLPTNAVGHFVVKFCADYGVMISASHNPPCDNGLKVFDNTGAKIFGAKEKEISDTMSLLQQDTITSRNCRYKRKLCGADKLYCNDILDKINVNLHGLNIAVDCCHGASCFVAKNLLESAGANVKAFCNSYNGRKINVNCGATHTEFLQSKLAKNNCNLAFAFDGDADRLAVFENGKFVSNNNVFYAMARYMKENNMLENNAVCGTILTNSGLEQSLAKLGIRLLRSDVGDINIFKLMQENGLVLGGEESGHYLLTDYATSSDALINMLFICKIYQEKGSIVEYSREVFDEPIAKQNITITESNEQLINETHLLEIKERTQKLFPTCRVILRKSGTEPVVRIYVEGKYSNEAVESIAKLFK